MGSDVDDTGRELTGEAALAWWQRFAAAFEREREALAELDRTAGDGDFGTNLRSALRRVDQRLAGGPTGSAGEVFARVSEGFLDTGGTSGPLYGMWFRALAKALAEERGLAAGVADGVATVRRLGGAAPGDSTMVDAMAPAAQALTGGADLAAAAVAAREGAESTRELRARRGRSSYTGDVSRGVLDPGAVTVALFFEAGAA